MHIYGIYMWTLLKKKVVYFTEFFILEKNIFNFHIYIGRGLENHKPVYHIHIFVSVQSQDLDFQRNYVRGLFVFIY